MYLSIWQDNLVGIALGGWLFTAAEQDGTTQSALMVFV